MPQTNLFKQTSVVLSKEVIEIVIVFVTRPIPEIGIKLLRKEGFEVKIRKRGAIPSKEELVAGVKNADALLCLLTDKIDKDVLSASKRLKVVANYAVGFDNVDVKAATERRIAVANTPGVLTETVAEHTFALLFAIARRIPEADRFARAGKYKAWGPLLLLGNDLNGKTLGIVGLGRIGSAVAKRAVGMGMNVIYTGKDRDSAFEKEFKSQYADLSTLLRTADFVSIHIPLLPETHHLIGKKELNMMKKTAYLINTARGPIIDEKALVASLREKRIAGAALDVFEFEPKIAAGLARLENVVLTPHIASATYETRSGMAEIAAKNIIAFFNGTKPPNCVNTEVLK